MNLGAWSKMRKYNTFCCWIPIVLLIGVQSAFEAC